MAVACQDFTYNSSEIDVVWRQNVGNITMVERSDVKNYEDAVAGPLLQTQYKMRQPCKRCALQRI